MAQGQQQNQPRQTNQQNAKPAEEPKAAPAPEQQPAAAPTAGVAGMAYPNAQLDPAASPPSQLYPANPGAAIAPVPFDAQAAAMNLRERIDAMNGNADVHGALIDGVTNDFELALRQGDVAGAQEYVNQLRANRGGLIKGVTPRAPQAAATPPQR